MLSNGIDLDDEVPAHCDTCGARVLSSCEQCGHRLKGRPVGVSMPVASPDFCDNCGAPHPWLSRQGRIYLLQGLLDDEQLDPATELEVREQLEELTSPELDEDEQRVGWERIRKLAPAFWESSGVRTVLESVVSAGIKASLGL